MEVYCRWCILQLQFPNRGLLYVMSAHLPGHSCKFDLTECHDITEVVQFWGAITCNLVYSVVILMLIYGAQMA